MKIRVEHAILEENEIVLRCEHLDEEMLEILSLLRERINKIPAYHEGNIHMLSPSELLYADSVDGKCFLYTKDHVFHTTQNLVQLETTYEDTGLIRISKSQLVNLYKVDSLKSLPNSRIQITLMNGEKLIASRHYIQNLKTKLGLEQKGDTI